MAALAILLGTGVLCAGAGYAMRTRRRLRGSARARLESGAMIALLGAAYGACAYTLFAREHVIVPLVVPVAIQLPAALVLSLLVRAAVHRQHVQAVCLVADAGGSTALGQRLPHDAYVELMTGYNRMLARRVAARGGLALAPQGDGFVSLWVLPSETPGHRDALIRLAACRAAIDMVSAARQFNEVRAPEQRLPLRIGVTAGAVTIWSDAERGAFEAIGDAVNLAARLQDVNRDLGTSVLAAGPVAGDLSDRVELRRIEKTPALKGITQVPEVFELLAPRGGPAAV
jgi:class 3 adenylate cyclase